MTTYVQAREAIVLHINQAWKTAYPTVPLYYENTTKVSLDKVGEMFVKVEINFLDNIRQGVDRSPITATEGEVSFSLFMKEGCGTVKAVKTMDFLMSLMKYKELPGVTLGCPTPGRKVEKNGWSSSDFNVPFSFFQ